MRLYEWMDHAACAGAPTSVFFPDKPGGPQDSDWLEARSYCAVCEVRNFCLDFVGEWETSDVRRNGMWAGMTPSERDEYFEKKHRARTR